MFLDGVIDGRDVMEGGGVTASPQELEEVFCKSWNQNVHIYFKSCQVEAGQEEDAACEKFRLRVARASDQVIRFFTNVI